MAKIRLTQGMRDHLYAVAIKNAVNPKEQKEFDRAYAKALPVMLKIVRAEYPETDMAICAKYGATTKDDCIRLALTPGGVDEFRFAEPDAPLVVGRSYSCRNRIYACDERGTTVFNAWKAARDALGAAKGQKDRDYKALLDGSRFLEEVEAVWPGASFIRASIVKNLPATITDDVLARIRQDVALQSRAA